MAGMVGERPSTEAYSRGVGGRAASVERKRGGLTVLTDPVSERERCETIRGPVFIPVSGAARV